MNITGVVLAGGMGRRMGGVDKGLVKFRDKPLIAHVLERIAPQVDSIIINANREEAAYSQFGHPVIGDAIHGFAGPLAGLQACMQHAASPLIATVPCDAPFLPGDLIPRLLDKLQTHQADLAVAKTGVQLHPVFCLCRTSLLDSLTDFLENGGRKIMLWQHSLNFVEVAFDDEEEAFANINTPEDMESAA
jgi:molybdopterin-guanine dinucleotide biosynthesis protein A